MAFSIKIEPEARRDIQEGIDWYNEQQAGLGREFHSAVKFHFKKLQANPFYQVRYEKVHCLPLKNFPYMIHFTINEIERHVIIHGVFNTFRDPGIWRERI
ncbi:hypothetical protein DYD21_07285 [Rhodohalobacter sp. SW132]|nr:hypothetical protein DYD21_07285 [Rhodohalobacter sp. SW132]